VSKFPPQPWPFAPLEDFHSYESSYVSDRQLGVEVLMRWERLVATHSRICTGGSQILRVRWAAEEILGDKFKGNTNDCTARYLNRTSFRYHT